MIHPPLHRRHLGTAVLLALGLALAGRAPAAEEIAAPAEVPAAAPATPPVLSLWDCRRIALEKQPALAAARASLAFAQARAAALDNLAVPAAIKHDLPIRRQQAALGVRVAQALLCTAEWDTLYNVTRNYISVLYAREQYQVAQRAVKELEQFRTDKDLPTTVWQKTQSEVYESLARGRGEAARAGYNQALAALREAMGEAPDFCFQLADEGLPEGNTTACRGDLLRLALERRGELVAASTLAEVAGLEVDAQGTTHLPSAQTFAAGSDLHAHPVPQGLRDGIYRPAAIAVEMPTVLAGSRSERVAQAEALAGRAHDVADKTRGLIALETDDAYARWAESTRQVEEFGQARKKEDALIKQTRESVQNATASPEDLFNVRMLARQSQVEHNTARYNLYLALAALERITAGGFCPGFDRLFSPQGLPAPAAAPAAPEQP
jgi:outer membrane protein TolC